MPGKYSTGRKHEFDGDSNNLLQPSNDEKMKHMHVRIVLLDVMVTENIYGDAYTFNNVHTASVHHFALWESMVHRQGKHRRK